RGVAVDGAGNVYVLAVKGDNTVVLRLTMGLSSQPDPAELPFHGLKDAIGIAVDASGRNIYVTDGAREGRLMRWTEGEMIEATELGNWKTPANKLKDPHGVAVDASGNIYVADTKNNRVLRVKANATAESADVEVLRLKVHEPVGVAVDARGIYVIDHGGDQHKSRLLKLPSGANTNQEEVSITDLDDPSGVAVNGAGDVYITDSRDHEVLKVPAGATNASPLPFTDLAKPTGVAVDASGNIYVSDDELAGVVTRHEG